MLFPLVREEFPLKKIKANTRPIKTLSSCYHLGTVLNIHNWSWFSLKILFPSALGITDLTRIQNSYNPLKKSITLTSPEKTHSDFIPVHSQCHACRSDAGWQGQRSALGALRSFSPPPLVLPIAFQEGGPRGTWHGGSVQRGYLQRAKLWFMLYGTKTTGMLFVYIIWLGFS